MKKLIYFAVLLLFSYTCVNAQVYSLEECIERAIHENLRIKQHSTKVQLNQVALQDTKDARLPIGQGSIGQGMNFGRSIDPYTNSFANQQIGFNNLGLNGSYTLYDGGKNKLLIDEKSWLLEASKYGLTSEKEQLTLQVILAYTQVLAAQELIVQATKQSEITKEQITKTQRLVSSGILPGNHLIDLRAQLANDIYGIVVAQSELNDSKLQLSQLMLLPLDSLSGVNAINEILLPDDLSARKVDTILKNSLFIRPSMKSVQARLRANSAAMRFAKLGASPTVSLNIGVGTNYSSAAKSILYGDEIVQQNTGAYVHLNDTRLPVLTDGYSSEVQNIGYFKQLGQNINAGFSLQVKIPIGNGRQIRNKVLQATFEKDLLLYEQKENEQQLRQGIERAVNQLIIAQDKYKALEDNVIALKEVFESAKTKLNAGTINAIEYTQTKSVYDKASLQLIQAKFECLMRKKVLDFYSQN